MRIFLRFLGFLFAAGAFVFVIGAVAASWLIWDYSKGLPDYSQLQDYEPPVMTRVHASDGALVAEYAKERRLYIPIQAVPKRVMDAFIAAEDKNFWEHGGIDLTGILRAVVTNIENWGKRRPQGASTITQQVAKNFLVGSETSIDRKIKEALLAMRIERAYTKQKILELYLNEIYLGLGAYGVAAASLIYFDKFARVDHRGWPICRAAQGADQSASVPSARARARAAQLGDRSHGRERLYHRRRRRESQADPAQCEPAADRRAHFRRRIFRRGSAPRSLRALRREEAL
jgi:penicillin-binding protein 1A